METQFVQKPASAWLFLNHVPEALVGLVAFEPPGIFAQTVQWPESLPDASRGGWTYGVVLMQAGLRLQTKSWVLVLPQPGSAL